ECPYPCKTKVKVEKWIDIADIEENNKFINVWHDFVKKVQLDIADNRYDDKAVRQINMFILTEFFVKDFDGNFYGDFAKRISEAGVKIG
ncbi:MAG: YkgJ family cysteine cluster protein, partial [Lachnospiraceae bacterium]